MLQWGLFAVLLTITLIVVIVNATRIERIRADLDSKSLEFVMPEIESLLIRGEGGDRIPKKAYWVTILPDHNPNSDVEELRVATGDETRDTDGQAFDADVASRRIRYVYRADQRSIFSIERTSGKFMVRPVSTGNKLRLAPAGMTEPRKVTLIGLPQSLITSSAGLV